ncbi:hypothetical protein SZ54_0580 [Rhizobium sp. UR51a]|nr:hypothetical protein SZ54_0580 [Rhizobium sp. UR51a]
MIKHTFKAILRISAPTMPKTWKIRHKILQTPGNRREAKKKI